MELFFLGRPDFFFEWQVFFFRRLGARFFSVSQLDFFLNGRIFLFFAGSVRVFFRRSDVFFLPAVFLFARFFPICLLMALCFFLLMARFFSCRLAVLKLYF